MMRKMAMLMIFRSEWWRGHIDEAEEVARRW
jgi:hypothetical protein